MKEDYLSLQIEEKRAELNRLADEALQKKENLSQRSLLDKSTELDLLIAERLKP